MKKILITQRIVIREKVNERCDALDQRYLFFLDSCTRSCKIVFFNVLFEEHLFFFVEYFLGVTTYNYRESKLININKASFKELIKHPYFDKDLTIKILKYRKQKKEKIIKSRPPEKKKCFYLISLRKEILPEKKNTTLCLGKFLIHSAPKLVILFYGSRSDLKVSRNSNITHIKRCSWFVFYDY